MAKRDYYEVLGLQKGASEEEIKKAYRKIAMANHPDTHPNDKAAEERFKEASEAYEVLSDAKKKSAYDQYGFAGVDGMAGGAAGNYQNVYRDFSDIFGGGSGFEDIFGSFFGGGMGSRTRRGGYQQTQQGQSLRLDVVLDFKEALFGCKKEISFAHEVACEKVEQVALGERLALLAEELARLHLEMVSSSLQLLARLAKAKVM